MQRPRRCCLVLICERQDSRCSSRGATCFTESSHMTTGQRIPPLCLCRSKQGLKISLESKGGLKDSSAHIRLQTAVKEPAGEREKKKKHCHFVPVFFFFRMFKSVIFLYCFKCLGLIDIVCAITRGDKFIFSRKRINPDARKPHQPPPRILDLSSPSPMDWS